MKSEDSAYFRMNSICRSSMALLTGLLKSKNRGREKRSLFLRFFTLNRSILRADWSIPGVAAAADEKRSIVSSYVCTCESVDIRAMKLQKNVTCFSCNL